MFVHGETRPVDGIPDPHYHVHGCRAPGPGGLTEGPKGVELLAQAVTAIRSCLEICTPESFPLDHKRAQEQLEECERLLAKLQTQ
jgi:hypothetical protein